MRTRSIMALVVLCVLCATVVMGARTDHKLTSGYFNAANITAAGGTVYYMSNAASGTTSVAADRKMARFWRFKIKGGGTVRVYTIAMPGWGGFSDTTQANSVAIALTPGQVWESEGLPIYAFKMTFGNELNVVARD